MGTSTQISAMGLGSSPVSSVGIAFVLAACAFFATPAIAESDQVARAPSGIPYVTGGVGSEAVDALKSMEKEFDLKLVFTNKAGDYLSAVKVTIADVSGKIDLDVTADGPVLMAKLPAGAYKVNATFGGNTQTRNVTIAAAMLTSISLEWTASHSEPTGVARTIER